MDPESGAALGVANLYVGNPNPVRRSIQLLLDTGDGVRAHRWDDLNPNSAAPTPSLHYLSLSPRLDYQAAATPQLLEYLRATVDRATASTRMPPLKTYW